MTDRLKKLGFSSRGTTRPPPQQQPTPPAQTMPQNLPPGAPGRPPSYSGYGPGAPGPPLQPPNAGMRPPIGANPQGPYPHGVPLGHPTGPQMIPPGIPPGIPPQHPPYYGHPPRDMQPPPAPAALGRPAEVEGSHRSSKAQLIVGVDFVSSFAAGTLKCTADQRHQGTTFSGVAFAFATDQEAKEDIITEWPGAGNVTKQKVIALSMRHHNIPSMLIVIAGFRFPQFCIMINIRKL